MIERIGHDHRDAGGKADQQRRPQARRTSVGFPFRTDEEPGHQRKAEPQEDFRPQIVEEGLPAHVFGKMHGGGKKETVESIVPIGGQVGCDGGELE